jgi:hypothetical protein
MSDMINMKRISDWYVLLTNLNGVPVDITDSIEQLSIYESIYNNCMFGNLAIHDDSGIIETLALVGSGEETITVFLETPNDSGMSTTTLEKEFVINSLSNVKRKMTGSGETSFNLGFVSPFLVKNNTTRISRSFNAMTSSEIVDYVSLDIMEFGMDPNFVFTTLMTNTETKHTKNIVVPNWKPFDLFNFLSKNSTSIDGKSDYVFFENNEGFHFTTIEDLKQKDITRMVTVSGKAGDPYESEPTNTGNNAEEWEELERFNISKNTAKGMYGGRIIAHNILTKSVEQYDIAGEPLDSILGDVGFADVFKKEQIPESHIGYMSSNYLYDIHDKEDRSHYPLYDMKISELRSNVVKFTIPGDTNIFAGDVIEILLPSTTGESEEMDMYMSGNFLITAIHHKINNAGYEMTIECYKDGFDFDIDTSMMELG